MAKRRPTQLEIFFEGYYTEIGIVAAKVIEAHGGKRDRALIRQTVEKHVADQQAQEKKADKAFEPLDTNRRQVVERGLAIGVTKLLEAWDYVALNKAWPPEGE